jgi:CRP-like cAMP-binding protein
MPPKRRKPRTFDAGAFLATIGKGRKILSFFENSTIFAQGDACHAVFHILTGRVKLTVVSQGGKEATIAILSDGTFFGEEGLIGQRSRMASATALTDCMIMRIEKTAMLRAIHSQHAFSDMFVEYLLSRNIRYQEDLVDQLFNSSEKRLARILLLFAGFGKNEIREKTPIPKISQETLAEMVGTTRPRVTFFMNKFRKLGFIDYNGEIEVHRSLLNVVLLD